MLSDFRNILIVLYLFTSCYNTTADTTHTEQLEINETIIQIEIADTPQKRTQGLSDKKSLPENHGMLFIFPKSGKRSFWMYHCYFDIDLAYIDEQGMLMQIITMLHEPYNTPPEKLKHYPSRSDKIKYVLEMNGGWFRKNKVTEGMKVDLARFATEE